MALYRDWAIALVFCKAQVKSRMWHWMQGCLYCIHLYCRTGSNWFLCQCEHLLPFLRCRAMTKYLRDVDPSLIRVWRRSSVFEIVSDTQTTLVQPLTSVVFSGLVALESTPRRWIHVVTRQTGNPGSNKWSSPDYCTSSDKVKANQFIFHKFAHRHYEYVWASLRIG